LVGKSIFFSCTFFFSLLFFATSTLSKHPFDALSYPLLSATASFLIMVFLLLLMCVATCPAVFAQATGFEPFCTNCSATFPNDLELRSCTEAVAAFDASSVTCAELRDTECSCCGFCAPEAQLPDYSACDSTTGDGWCNFCTSSEYAAQPIFAQVCREQPKNWLAGLLLSLFLGFFGAGYFYYGYMGLGAAMLLVFFVLLIVAIVLLCQKVMAGGIPACIGACGVAIWGLVVCILIGLNQLLPAQNEYEAFCPITCYAKT
jgi:hypothetical protein